MPTLTNPMDGLVSLQRALRRGDVRLEPCQLHPELQVLLDRPNGEMRLTYAVIDHGRVRATVVFAEAERVDGVPCFGIGYAVAEPFRRHGLATATVTKSIEELRHGLRRVSPNPFYIEAIVATSNEASNRLSQRVISDTPAPGTDSISGEPVLQYLKRVE